MAVSITVDDENKQLTLLSERYSIKELLLVLSKYPDFTLLTTNEYYEEEASIEIRQEEDEVHLLGESDLGIIN